MYRGGLNYMRYSGQRYRRARGLYRWPANHHRPDTTGDAANPEEIQDGTYARNWIARKRVGTRVVLKLPASASKNTRSNAWESDCAA